VLEWQDTQSPRQAAESAPPGGRAFNGEMAPAPSRDSSAGHPLRLTSWGPTRWQYAS